MFEKIMPINADPEGLTQIKSEAELLRSFKSITAWPIAIGIIIGLYSIFVLITGDLFALALLALLAIIFIYIGLKIGELPEANQMRNLLILLCLLSFFAASGIIPIICFVMAIIRLTKMSKYRTWSDRYYGKATLSPLDSKAIDLLKPKTERLESILIKLDRGCKEGEIENTLLEKSQNYLNSISDDFLSIDPIPREASIIYETQSLLHWARGEYDDAVELAKSASIIGETDLLLTSTANDILHAS